MENVEDIYNLSPIQKGILLHSLSSPDSSELYFVQLEAELEPGVDTAAFLQAWQVVIDRHPMLRTAFIWEDFDEPLQIVHEHVELPVEQFDWSDYCAADQAAKLTAWLGEDRQRGFDVSSAPLLRLAIIKTAADGHKFVFTFHVLLLDGWSKGRVFKEVFETYAALVRGETPQLDPAQPFKRYIGWLQEQDQSEAERFWRKRLKGFVAPLSLAAGQTGGPAVAGHGDETIEIGSELLVRVKAFATRQHLTVNTVFQAAWALLLSRYSSATDVVYGAAVSGRPPTLVGADAIVGLMINNVPVRVQVDPQLPLLSWLKQFQEQQNELLNYENTPLPLIQQWSEVHPRRPLFESLLLFQNWPDVDVFSQLRNLRFHPLVRTMYPLTLFVLPKGNSLLINLAYEHSRVEDTSARLMLQHLLSLIEKMLADPEQVLRQVCATIPETGLFELTPAVEYYDQQRAEDHVEPMTEIEKTIAGICCEVLGIKRIGTRDSFFELGGHSLVATEIVSLIARVFDVELPLRSLFESPTVAGLAVAVEQHKGLNHFEALPTLTPAPHDRFEPFPLTECQQAYWVGRTSAFELGSIASRAYLEIEAADFDEGRFEAAWSRAIERHDMLRMIVLDDGRQQVLESPPPYEIEITDLSGCDLKQVTARLEEIHAEMFHALVPPDRWPLFELRISRLDDQRARIHFSFDLLTVDAGSIAIILRELSLLYRGSNTALPNLDLSFRDYVLAEAATKDSPQYRRSRDYWFNRLEDFPPAPGLPLAKSPRSISSVRFVRQVAGLDVQASARLKATAAKLGLTTSSVLLTAYAYVLARWSSASRLTINIPIFNRLPLHPNVEHVVGAFTSINLLAVDHSLPANFVTRARALQQQLANDLDNRYVNGIEVMRELARRGRPASMPVVFTSLLDVGLGAASKELGEVVRGINQTAQVWMDLHVDEHDGELVFKWDSVEGLFPDGLIRDMSEGYCNLLQQLAQDNGAWDRTDLELLPQAHLEQRLSANATASPAPAVLIQDLLAAQVVRQPQGRAIVSASQTLTYEELYRLSMQVGRRLRDLSARPNRLVAVVMEKGWEQIVAVYGILQSGAAYLPIDPEFPKERIWYLLEHSQVELVLTQSWLNEKLEWPRNIRRLCVDGDEWSTISDRPLESVQSPEDLAYVLYTSGSTGVPKGVMIEHRSVVNRVVDVNDRFGIGPNDCALALTALQHDLSVYDMFGILAAGGTLVIPAAANRRDPAHWSKLVLKEEITLWNSVPAFMEMFVEHLEHLKERGNGHAIVPASLRLVLLSGDWIPVSVPDRLRAFVQDVSLVSLGGPTETTVWDICYNIGRVNPEWKSIPYGRPMLNASYHVLNEALEPCPAWVPGQMHIGGIGVGRGYWGDEEKSSASFIKHPQSGERLYRSGDVGRYLPDGNIEFIGRSDFQVKISGQRIELGEIETTLKQSPQVRDAVVTVDDVTPGNKRLVAYIVTEKQASAQPCLAKPEENGTNGSLASLPRKGSILTGVELMEFKLKHLGIRQQDEDKTKVELPKPPIDRSFQEGYLQRQSHRNFRGGVIPFDQFSNFLACLYQLQLEELPLPKYRYPSAGSLYPVQAYLYVKENRVEGLDGGTYYYHPAEHCLVLLSAGATIDRSVYTENNYAVADESAFALVLVGQLKAITPMYGELARDFCLLEAGYMGQLLMSGAPANNIGLCPLGSMDFDRVRSLFSLDEDHIYLHMLLGGQIEPAQTKTFMSVQESAAAITRVDGTARNGADIYKDLRAFLGSKLPQYMVPSVFVPLDALPLTPNGKVNRRALPKPDGAITSEVSYTAPQGGMEQTVARVFEQVLRLERVGVHDNFFDLGGTSIHIIQAHGKLQSAVGRNISVVDLFGNPTVSSLAKHLSSGAPEKPAFRKSYDRAEARRGARARSRQSSPIG